MHERCRDTVYQRRTAESMENMCGYETEAGGHEDHPYPSRIAAPSTKDRYAGGGRLFKNWIACCAVAILTTLMWRATLSASA